MHTPMNKAPAGLGNTITPMLSNRGNHDMILGLIHKHHNEYLAGLEQLEKQGQEELNEELRKHKQWVAPAWFPRLQDEARDERAAAQRAAGA